MRTATNQVGFTIERFALPAGWTAFTAPFQDLALGIWLAGVLREWDGHSEFRIYPALAVR